MIDDGEIRDALRAAVAGPPAGFVDELVRVAARAGEYAVPPAGRSPDGANADIDADAGPATRRTTRRNRWRTPVVLGVAAALLTAVLVAARLRRSDGPAAPSSSVKAPVVPASSDDRSGTTPPSPASTVGASATTVDGPHTTVAHLPTIVPGPPPDGCTDAAADGTMRRAPAGADEALVATFRRCDVGIRTFAVGEADVWGASTSAAGEPELVHLDAALAPVARFTIAHEPLAIAVDGPVVWVVWDTGQGIHLAGIDATDGRVRMELALRDEPSIADGVVPPVRLALGRSGPRSGTTRVTERLWVTLGRTPAIHQLDPAASHDTVIAAPTVPVDIAPHGSFLAVIGVDGTVAEVAAGIPDPVVLGTVAAPGVAIAADGSRLWAAGATEVVQFDEGLRTVVDRIPGWAGSLAIDPVRPGTVWAAPFEPDPGQRPGRGAGAIVAFDGTRPVVSTAFETVSNNGVSRLVIGPTGAVFGSNGYGGTLLRLLVDGRRDPGVLAGSTTWPSLGAVQVVGTASPADVVAFDDRSGGRVCVGVRIGTSVVMDGCSADDGWTAVQLGDDGSMYVVGRRRGATPIDATTTSGPLVVTLFDDGTGHGVFALRLVGSADLLSLDGAPGATGAPCTYRDIAAAGAGARFEFQPVTPVALDACDGRQMRLTLVPSAEQPHPGRAELVREDDFWRLASASQTP